MKYVLIVAVFLVAPVFARAAVVINEVAWMGTANSANDEWMELYNNGSSAVGLDGWHLSAADGSPDIALSGSIPAGGYFLLERSNDDTVPGVAADQIYTGALSNSGEHLILRDGLGSTVDEIDASAGWPGGDNTTKETIQRAGAQWITATATPRAVNAGAAVGNISNNAPSPASTFAPSSTPLASFVPLPVQMIHAYSGEDTVAAVGSPVEFIGAAAGLKNEPIDNARFWWNFGDGETQEGRSVTHLYRIPGAYTAGLHISSGSYAASDYRAVRVVPNQISIKNVVGGAQGYVQFGNPSGVAVDVGGWIISDSSRRSFVIPVGTVIGAQSDIAFANAVTGLLHDGPAAPVRVSYFNQELAMEWKPSVSVVPVTSVPTPQNGAPVSRTPSAPAAAFGETERTQNFIASSSLPENAQVIDASFGSPRAFFLIAFGVSLLAAGGFLFVRRTKPL